MHKPNLLKAVEYLYFHVKESQFNIIQFRLDSPKHAADLNNPICNSIGCAAGHLTAIIPEHKIIRYESIVLGKKSDVINFYLTTKGSLELHDYEWRFLFSPHWILHDKTLKGVCKRIIYLLKHESVPNTISYAFPLYNEINIKKEIEALRKQLLA